MVRTTLGCLAIAAGLRLTFDAATGQTVETPREPRQAVTRSTPVRNLFDYAHTYIVPGKIALEWRFYTEARVWLEVKTADSRGWPNDGWHPSYTVLLTQYKPIVIKQGDKYEITFTQGEAKVMP